MNSLNSRLRRLEEARRDGLCPECKLSPDGPGYVVYKEGEEAPKDPDERCPSCGRFLWFVIRVVYGPEENAEEGDLRWP